MYSNSCCSCSFEPEIRKIGQSSHKVYRNNIVNLQESTTILNACTKKSGNLLKAPCIHSWIIKQFYFLQFNLAWVTCLPGNLLNSPCIKKTNSPGLKLSKGNPKLDSLNLIFWRRYHWGMRKVLVNGQILGLFTKTCIRKINFKKFTFDCLKFWYEALMIFLKTLNDKISTWGYAFGPFNLNYKIFW